MLSFITQNFILRSIHIEHLKIWFNEYRIQNYKKIEIFNMLKFNINYQIITAPIQIS